MTVLIVAAYLAVVMVVAAGVVEIGRSHLK